MAGQGSVFVHHKGVVMWLLGLIIVFQIMAHLKMWSALDAEERAGRDFGRRASSEEWCVANLGPTSPRCLEAELFRSWQQSASWPSVHSELGLEAKVEDMPISKRNASGDVVDFDTGVEESLIGSGVQAIFGLTTNPTTSSTPGQVAPLTSHAGTTPEEERPWSPMTAWAQGLVDLQRSLEDRFNALPSERHRQARQRAEEFDRLEKQVSASLEGSTGKTKWAEDLEALQRRLEEKEASLPSHQGLEARLDREAAKVTEKLEANSAGSRWGEDLGKLQGELAARQAALPSQRGAGATGKVAEPTLMDQINAVHREMCLEPQHRDLAACVDFLAGLAASHETTLDAKRLQRSRAVAAAHAAGRKTKTSSSPAEELAEHKAQLQADLARIAAEREAWEQQFQGKVNGIYADFCAARGGVWCTTPAPMAATPLTERSAAKAALRANITKEANERAAALDARLAKMAEDRKEWERALLEHYGVAGSVRSSARETAGRSSSTTPIPLWSGVANLRWSAVAAWASGAQLRGREHAEVVPSALESAKWVGALPKVASVTAIPLGHGAKSQVKYVIESFNKQTYEGPKQLVLVYHHEDEEAAEVVRMYADGAYVKGVAARGPREDFPSSTALRFGAWSADADVIAQWDFDEQQHPQRLALQIRALAFTSKPACLLRPARGAAEAAAAATLRETSLLGEAAWMREHWHPGLEEQQAVLRGAQAHNVVALATDTGMLAGEPLQSMRSKMDRHYEGLVQLLEGDAAKPEASPAGAAAA